MADITAEKIDLLNEIMDKVCIGLTDVLEMSMLSKGNVDTPIYYSPSENYFDFVPDRYTDSLKLCDLVYSNAKSLTPIESTRAARLLLSSMIVQIDQSLAIYLGL